MNKLYSCWWLISVQLTKGTAYEEIFFGGWGVTVDLYYIINFQMY